MYIEPKATCQINSSNLLFLQSATDDDDLLGNLRNAAQDVTDALNNLLQHIREGSRVRPCGQYDSACDDILNATDKLFNSMGNAGEMVKQAKVLAQVNVGLSDIFFQHTLLTHISSVFHFSPPENRARDFLMFSGVIEREHWSEIG